MSTLRSIMNEIVPERTQSLFESLGIAIVPCPPLDMTSELVAVIGFTADAVRGALGLTVSPGLAQMATHAMGSGQAPIDDWLGEAANQLLGRVKNRLLDWRIPISMALPMVLRGLQVRLCARAQDPISSFSFVAGAERVLVWMDCQVIGDLVIEPRSDPGEQAMDEGGMVLF